MFFAKHPKQKADKEVFFKGKHREALVSNWGLNGGVSLLIIENSKRCVNLRRVFVEAVEAKSL